MLKLNKFFFKFFLSLLFPLLYLFLIYKPVNAQVCSGSVVSRNLYRCISDNLNGQVCDQTLTNTSPCTGASCAGISYVADNCIEGVDVYNRSTCQAHNTAFGGATTGCFFATNPPAPTGGGGGGGGGATPTPGTPVALTPSGTLACPSTNSTNVAFDWNAAPNAGQYQVRIDDQSNGWLACAIPSYTGPAATPYPGDYCFETTSTAATRSLGANNNFKWWVSAFDSAGNVQGGFSSTLSFTVPAVCPTATPAPVACTVSLSPASVSLVDGAAGQVLTGTISSGQGSASVNSMTFQSNNSAIATVSPLTDSSSAFTTTVTGQSAGTTTISASANLSDGRVCNTTTSTDTGVTVTAAKACTVVLAPSSSSIVDGSTTTYSATVTGVTGGTLDSVQFVTSNAAIASVCGTGTTPCAASSANFTDSAGSPYSAHYTGNSAGSITVTARVTVGGTASTCIDTATLTVTAPSPSPAPVACAVTTTPATLSLVDGRTGTVTASVTSGLSGATIDSMAFGSYNTAIVTVSPTSDLTSPFTTTATAQSPGSAAVWATATLSDGRTCQSSGTTDTNVTVTAPTPSPSPAPVACAVTTSPATLSLVDGRTGTITASVTGGLGSATVDSMAFGSYNTAIVTVSPTSDASSPFTTTATAQSPGTAAVWATATLSDGRTCQSAGTADTNVTVTAPTPSPSPAPVACAVTTSPATLSLVDGRTGTVTASVTSGLGSDTVDSMAFGSYNTAIVTVSPTSDITSPFTTTVTAQSPGTAAVWATATLSDGRVCQSSGTTDSNVTVTAPTPSPSPAPVACAVTTTPTTLSLVDGATSTVTASVTSGLSGATVDSMAFGSYNTAIVTVNPTSDASSPFSTNVTAQSAGTAAVWATATLSDGRTCQSSGTTDSNITVTNPTPSPSPAPVACNVTTSPATLSIVDGGNAVITASVTTGLGGATVNSMAFGSYNTAIATVSPTSDSSSPFSTTVTGVSAGTASVWATATLSDGRTCQSSGTTDTGVTVTNPTPVPTPIPCAVTASPAVLNIVRGGTGTVTASVTTGLSGSTVNTMAFGSYNTAIATVSPTSDSTSPFATTVTGVAAGSTAIWATATLADGRICQSAGTADSDTNVTAPTASPAPTRTPTPTPAPTASPVPTPLACTVTALPANISSVIGGTATVAASVSSGLGSATVIQMLFGSYNTAIATVNPNSDTTSTFNTTVTMVAGGTTAVWATANLSDGRTCQSTSATDSNINVTGATPSPTPVPTPSPATVLCTVTVSPLNLNLIKGSTGTVSATVTSGLSGATVSQMLFGSYNTVIATVSPGSDSASPFTTTVTSLAAGSTAVWATANLSDGRVCQSTSGTDSNINVTLPTPTPTAVPIPSCTGTLQPDPFYDIGDTGTLTSDFNCNFPIDQINYTTTDAAVATVTPSTVNSPPFTSTTTATALSSGTTTITAHVIIGGVERYRTDALITVRNSSPAWWQVINADAGSGGNLTSNVLTPNYFSLPGSGNFPGIPTYASSSLTYDTSSQNQHWLVESTSPVSKSITSQAITNLIPSDVIINPLVSPVDNTSFSATGSSYGYTWYKSTGDLTINGNLTLGSKKVILIVEGGDLIINSRINLIDGSGFFMAIVGKNSAGLKGNIIVGSGVGGTGSPELEGLYEADGTFSDSVGNTQLWVRGSVVANKGVSLLRDLVAANSNTPSEIFEFATDQALAYPAKLGIRRLNWKEVAP